ncbi:MAG: hypothetical protein ACWA5Q_00105 [bacterium]
MALTPLICYDRKNKNTFIVIIGLAILIANLAVGGMFLEWRVTQFEESEPKISNFQVPPKKLARHREIESLMKKRGLNKQEFAEWEELVNDSTLKWSSQPFINDVVFLGIENRNAEVVNILKGQGLEPNEIEEYLGIKIDQDE